MKDLSVDWNNSAKEWWERGGRELWYKYWNDRALSTKGERI